MKRPGISQRVIQPQAGLFSCQNAFHRLWISAYFAADLIQRQSIVRKLPSMFDLTIVQRLVANHAARFSESSSNRIAVNPMAISQHLERITALVLSTKYAKEHRSNASLWVKACRTNTRNFPQYRSNFATSQHPS